MKFGVGAAQLYLQICMQQKLAGRCRKTCPLYHVICWHGVTNWPYDLLEDIRKHEDWTK